MIECLLQGSDLDARRVALGPSQVGHNARADGSNKESEYYENYEQFNQSEASIVSNSVC